MLSDRAFMALADLEDGARLNCIHPVARELIAAGLAIDDFGFLCLTEAGRSRIRAKNSRRFVVNDDNVADLSYRIDPMANPNTQTPEKLALSVRVEETVVEKTDIKPAVLEPTTDLTVKAYRAAGVATGRTGIEAQPGWVVAFVEAWIEL